MVGWFFKGIDRVGRKKRDYIGFFWFAHPYLAPTNSGWAHKPKHNWILTQAWKNVENKSNADIAGKEYSGHSASTLLLKSNSFR